MRGFEEDWSDVRAKVDPNVFTSEGTTAAGPDFNLAWITLEGDRQVFGFFVNEQGKELTPPCDVVAEPEGSGMVIKTLTFKAVRAVGLVGLNLYTSDDLLVLTHRFPVAISMAPGDVFKLGPFMISFS